MKCYGPHSSHYKHDYKKKNSRGGDSNPDPQHNNPAR
jgi:hypothetical protein